VDYTASTGTTVTGLTALVAGDIVTVSSPSSFQVANAIPKSTVTAKGDLLVATGASTPANLAVGADGSTLVANSASATGMAWAGPTFAAGKNKIINGDFGVWQRGTSFSAIADSTYFADRFVTNWSAGGASNTYSRQTFTPGTAPVSGYEGTYFARAAATGATGSTQIGMGQRIEDVRIFAGQTVTYSFWAKADSARTISCYIQQNFGSGGSSTVASSVTVGAITTSWARYSITVTLGSLTGKTIGTSSYLQFDIYAGSQTGSPTFDIWGIQLEAGSVATPFTTATGTLQGELAACQRYYYRAGGQAAYQTLASAYSSSSTNAYAVMALPVPMRIIPTSIDYSTICFQDSADGISGSFSAVSFSSPGLQTVRVSCTTTGLTANRPGVILTNNSTSGYLGFNAEL